MATKTKTSAADAKKALVSEYLELSASKLGLVYNEADADDKMYISATKRKPMLVLASEVAQLKQLPDYDDAPAAVAARPVAVTVLPEKPRSDGGNLPTGFGQTVHTNGISDAQFPLYIKLAKEKLGLDIMAEGNEAMLAHVKAMSKAQATKEISGMIKLPRIAQPAAPKAPVAVAAPATATPAIPAGIYAIEDDEIKCYLVDYGREGTQWAGFLFLSRISSDDKYAIRNREEKARILAEINIDVEAAGRLAAHTLRQCRNPKCRRTLSDTKNPYFEIGYGPKCGAGGMD